MLKIATVCTGIGSPEQSLKELEIEHKIVFACEKDKYARQTYLANFKCNQMFEDMTNQDWHGEDKYSDIFIGGIPCQSFSLAGKRMGINDARGLLFYNFYDYVKIQQPKYFIIENVKGLLSDAKGRTFQSWMELLGASVNNQYNMINHEDSLLYNLHHTVLNSKNFGVPQNRERVFLVGIRNDLPNDFNFPIGGGYKLKLKDILENEVDEKYYLSNKMLDSFKNWKSRQNPLDKIFTGEDIMSCVLARGDGEIHAGMKLIKESSKIIGYTRDKNGNVISRNLKDESNTIHTSTGSGGNTDQFIIENPEPFIIQRSEQRLTGKLTERDIVPTLKSETKKGDSEANVVFNSRIRRLTPLECFRLQGYPDQYIKPVSDSQLYKQAGNSITVNVMKAVLKNLLK